MTTRARDPRVVPGSRVAWRVPGLAAARLAWTLLSLVVVHAGGIAGGATAARADEAAAPAFIVPLPTPGLDPPTLIAKVAPLYPGDARQAGVEGAVVVAARIGRDGRVREAHAEYSIPALDDAAIAAVRRYEFSPAHRAGVETEDWVSVPVRFDSSLPAGGREPARIEVERQSEPERRLEGDAAAMLQLTDALPGSDDIELRQRIMRESLSLDVIPAPGDEAVRSLCAGDSLAALPGGIARGAVQLAWSRSARLAPWWPLPYRRLASAALAVRDFEAAEFCASVVLAGRPGDSEAEALFRRAHQLNLEHRKHEKKKGKGGH
jgi:TonB family protein